MASDHETRGEVGAAIRAACQSQFGALDSKFLCQAVSALNPNAPLTVRPSVTVGEVIEVFRHNRVGCVLVTDASEKLVGIFSERDLVLKVPLVTQAAFAQPIADFMTRDPVSERPDVTVAYALNLMSQGGFRHLPLVDDEHHAVGILSVKDVVDYLVRQMTEDLMSFEIPEGVDDPGL